MYIIQNNHNRTKVKALAVLADLNLAYEYFKSLALQIGFARFVLPVMLLRTVINSICSLII